MLLYVRYFIKHQDMKIILQGGNKMKIVEMMEKKKREKAKRERIKLAKKVSAGAAAGVVAGAISGILLAPKSGKETQEDIAKTAKDLGENIKNKTVEFKGNVDNKVTETKGNVVEAKEKISQYLAEKKAARKGCCCDEAVTEDEVKEIEIPAEVEE